MITAYVVGELIFDNRVIDTDIVLEFSKLFNGISIALIRTPHGVNIISLFCTAEDNVLSQAQEIAKRKFQKFYEFLKVAMPNKITLRKEVFGGHYETSDPNIEYTEVTSLLDNITKTEFEKYLVEPNISASRLLLEGLEDYKNGKIFDAFSKLVNYSDDRPEVKQFCALRDCVSHREVNIARPKVEQKFPNEFEFIGDQFRRDSDKNIQNLKKYWPQVLKEAQAKFFSMVKNPLY